MKVCELLESLTSEAVKRAKLTKSEIDALPAPDARNINDRYRVGSVAFDMQKGLGAVPNNQEVDYLGFAMEIPASDFTKFALKADRSDSASAIEKLIKEENCSLGAPFLNVTYNVKEFGQGEPLKVEVVGHEGRARALAFHSIEGSTKLPVHVFVKYNIRAHDLDERFFEELRKVGMVPEKTNIKPMKLNIGRIFWMGKIL